MYSKCFSFGIILLFSTFLYSTEDGVDLKPIGYGGFEAGQIGQGYFRQSGQTFPSKIDHIWQQRAYCVIGYKAVAQQKLEMCVTGGGMFAFSTPQISDDPVTMQTRQLFYIESAFARYPLFGDLENPLLQIQLGYFPYKYSPDAKNLGEYLFRTNTYPLVIYSDFDYPKVSLLGIRVNTQLFNKMLVNDLLLHSELLGVPVQDWSLTDIVSVNLFNCASIGFGGSLTHFFDVYQGHGYLTTWMDTYYGDPRRLDEQNKIYYRLIDGTDTSFIDWKAIKVMTRLSFDPKRFIPLSIFGENDLKLYAEGDIIGLKNFRPIYNYLEDRTIASFGFNLPGFKYIDVINAEGEFCSNKKYAYSDELYYGARPVPMPIKYSDINIKRNPWRWSVYIKKSIINGHLNFIGQVARDHKKINFYYFKKSYMSFIETLPEQDNWWWVFKTEFKF